MEIESVKTWQWMLAGLFVGLLFSCIVAWSGPTFESQARDTIEQGEFEHDVFALTKYGQVTGLVREYHANLPLLKDLTVHPPVAGDSAHTYWVTGRFYFVGEQPSDPTKANSPRKVYEQWKPFKYPASVPYTPGFTVRQEKKLDRGDSPKQRVINQEWADLKKSLGGQATFLTVNDYLKAVAALPDAKLSFQYAWWELPVPKWTLPPLAGFLLIGVSWPLLLGVLQNFGLSKPVPVKAVSRPPAPTIKPIRSVGTPVVVAPVLPKPPPPEDERKYGGEFYPVVKVSHKD